MNPLIPALKDRAETLLLRVSALLAAVGWTHAAVAAMAAIRFRYAHNYAEPSVAVIVLNIPSNPLLYRGFDSEPFLVNPYNPLYFYVSWLVMFFEKAPLAAGRMVSFAAGIAACALIYRVLRVLDTRRSIALIAAALFIRIPPVAAQWATVRPDMTGLALSLGALACFLLYEKRQGGRSAYAAGIALSVLAAMTKQNFIAAPACYFLYLAMDRRWRSMTALAAWMAAGVGVPTLLWDHWTHGAYFLNQRMSLQKAFYPELFLRLWKAFVAQNAGLAAATAGAAVGMAVGGYRQKRFRMPVLFLALTLLSTVTLGKIGSDLNYFMEPAAAGCIVIAVFWSGLIGRGWKGLSGLKPVAAALITAALAVHSIPAAGGLIRAVRTPATADTGHAFDPIVELIRRVNGPVLAENMGLLIAAGKPIVYEPYEFTQLTYAGLWDEKVILEKLARGEFPLILLETNLWKINRSSRFSPAFVQHLRRHYRPVKMLAGQILCVPAASADAGITPR